MKAGIVAIIGRPNGGKSTLLNNIIGQKVSITSPKPQTTRFPVYALYEDERGQIVFIDTPGVFAKSEDLLSKIINPLAEKSLKENIDVVIYVTDPTRPRDIEDNKSLGIVRKFKLPKILVYNKSDIKHPSYLPHYKFLEVEFEKSLHISALQHSNINLLLDSIFDYLPERKKPLYENKGPSPLINFDSKAFIAEIIREKTFLFLRKELPYSLTSIVDEITERNEKLLIINAKIITNNDRYKKMIIGEKGRMIKEIGSAARKELEVATNKKVYLDITVEVDTHWMEKYLKY
jgi:GTP-binding protein Era